MIPKIIFIKYNNSMNIVINNNTTSIDSINQKLIDQISSLLSFTDKSKQYQLKRLSKSVWGKSSQKAAQLKTEIHQSLVVVKSDTSIEIPTRLLHLITPIVDISRAQDLRCDTGTKISLPWVNRPSTMRPYQEEAVDIITNNWCGLINFATGLGKTLTAVHAIRSLGRKTLIVCPNKSIAQQFHEILVSAFGSHRVGFFGDGKKSIKDLTVGIAQSVNNHLPEFKKHDLGFVLVDECFPYRENIATENGPMEIGRLVKNWEEGIPNPRVKSWNEDKKIFEYKNITYAWRKTNPNLVKVEYSKRVIECTPNHKLLTNKGWKSAGDLVNGDLLLGSTGTKSERHILNLLNQDQFDFLIGSFLGDGHINQVGNGRYRLSFTHGMSQKDYIEWKAWLLNKKTRLLEKNGYSGKSALKLTSKCFDLEETLPKVKSFCPQWVIDKINPKSLAIWFMDDGSISRKGDSAKIATCSFDQNSVERLADKLNSMQINCKAVFVKYKGIRAPGYWSIRINSKGTKVLKNIIAPYIHESMLYKINYDNRDHIYIWNNQFLDQGYGLVEKVTPYKAKLKGGRQPFVFDIEVEDNHNFIVCSSNDSSGIIAHNCHHIAADTLFNITKGLGDVGRIFGLTATDFRSDGKDLLIAAGCGETLIRRDAKWGIENGWLAKPYFIVRHVATDGKDYPDDKLKNYKAHVLNCQIMKDQIQSDAQSFINAGKRVLIIVDEIAHGQELSNALGIPFATGEDKQSQTYINDFNNLKIVGLVATDGKVGEGVDTRPVEVLIIANFVASKGAVLQVIGRGLRKIPGKDKCLILDYIPSGSRMLQRHAMQRISYFKELTENVRII